MTVNNLFKILEHLKAAGLGEEELCAQHDEIYLPGGQDIATQLAGFGLLYSKSDGSCMVFT